MTQEPSRGGKEAHPLPKDRRITTNVTGFIEKHHYKEHKVGYDDSETQDWKRPREVFYREFLYSDKRLKEHNAQEVQTDADLVDCRSNTEGHSSHEESSQCGYGANREDGTLEISILFAVATESQHEQDNDSVAEWGGENGA